MANKRLIRLPEVRERTGVPTSTIYYWIHKGTFPAPKKIGERASAWLLSDIEDWIQSKAEGGSNE